MVIGWGPRDLCISDSRAILCVRLDQFAAFFSRCGSMLDWLHLNGACRLHCAVKLHPCNPNDKLRITYYSSMGAGESGPISLL